MRRDPCRLSRLRSLPLRLIGGCHRKNTHKFPCSLEIVRVRGQYLALLVVKSRTGRCVHPWICLTDNLE